MLEALKMSWDSSGTFHTRQVLSMPPVTARSARPTSSARASACEHHLIFSCLLAAESVRRSGRPATGLLSLWLLPKAERLQECEATPAPMCECAGPVACPEAVHALLCPESGQPMP